MNQSFRWFLLSLPLLALGLLWSSLPDRVVIHTASADQWMTRDDFGGVVVATTAVVALVAYGLLQLQMAFQPLSLRARHIAYTTIAGGSALIGLALLGIGLLGR